MIPAYLMIDFHTTFQADELLDGVKKKMSLMSEIMFRRFLRQIKKRKKYLLRKL